MATKKDIKELLKTMELTETDMDDFWNDLLETNWIVKNLNGSGKTWRDMNISVIAKMPTQKQRDIESIERKNTEEKENKAKELKEKQDKEYYNSHFEEVMLTKIDNNENLTEREISRLAYDYEIEREEGDDSRWSRSITSHVQIGERSFCIEWNRGLTECQENEFYNRPCEVEKKTYEKIIPEHIEVTTQWVVRNK